MANILIIGAGVAGLSCGIHALLRSHSVTIVEKHTIPGGNLTGWRREGCYIDNCIHWLTGTNERTEAYRIWETLGALGKDVKILYPSSLYTYADRGNSLSLSKDLTVFEEQLLQISPGDKREISLLVRAIRACALLSGAEECRSTPANIKKAASVLLLSRYLFMTVGDLAKRFQHPFLRSFLTSFICEDAGSLCYLAAAAAFCSGNGGVPEGGSLPMANRMAERFLQLGGKLMTGRAAVSVCKNELGEAKALLLDNGESLAFDYLVPACEPSGFFTKVLGAPLPGALERRLTGSSFFSFSCFHTALLCDEPSLPFEGDLIIDLTPNEAFHLGAQRLIIRAFTGESCAVGEKSLLQTMVFWRKEACRRMIELSRKPEEYRRRKEHLALLTQKALLRALPRLENKTKIIDVWTPATYRKFVNSDDGSFMAPLFGKGYLPAAASCRVKGFQNIILACQELRLPGGLPNAALAGKTAALTVDLLEKRRAKAKNERNSGKIPLKNESAASPSLR